MPTGIAKTVCRAVGAGVTWGVAAGGRGPGGLGCARGVRRTRGAREGRLPDNGRVLEMTREEFEELVAEALDRIPPELTRLMDNVAVFVEDEPPADDPELLGLYEGTPLTDRGEWYAGVLPDRITIYLGPTLRMCAGREDVVGQESSGGPAGEPSGWAAPGEPEAPAGAQVPVLGEPGVAAEAGAGQGAEPGAGSGGVAAGGSGGPSHALRDAVRDEVAITVVHEVAHHFGIEDERLHELGWG